MDFTDETIRRKELGLRSQAEISEFVGKLSPKELIAIARSTIRGLGVYEVSLVKRERVGSKLLAAQTVKITMRETPRAARLEFVAGPAKGRKVLYNEELRRDEMRVREPGALGLVGGLWIGLDNPLARADSRHPVTDVGYSALLGFLERDLDGAEPLGGHERRDIGFDANGLWTTEFVAPKAARHLEVRRARFTLDLAAGLPVEIEAHDDSGVLEHHRYELVRRGIEVPRGFFEPKSFGI
jgi:hypothetical protein